MPSKPKRRAIAHKTFARKAEPVFSKMEYGAKTQSSKIARVETGIPGFDEVIGGGLPSGGLYLLSGKCGTGKTTFGLQFLHHGAKNGEPGLFIALEKESEEIIESTKKFDWEFENQVKKGAIAVVKPDMHRFESFKKTLEDQIYRIGAKRLVIDPFSLISAYFHNEVFDVRRSIVELSAMAKRMGCTTLITSDIPEGSPFLSYNGYMEFVVGGVIVLDLVKKDASTFVRAVFVRKMQDTQHSLKLVPVEISKEGISAYPDAEVF